jgi:hypothetical protein
MGDCFPECASYSYLLCELLRIPEVTYSIFVCRWMSHQVTAALYWNECSFPELYWILSSNWRDAAIALWVTHFSIKYGDSTVTPERKNLSAGHEISLILWDRMVHKSRHWAILYFRSMYSSLKLKKKTKLRGF